MSEPAETAEAGRPRSRFSWVTVLALLAIVGIIAAVVIPSYGDYRHRSQNTEAITLLVVAKTPLAEYFAEHKKWPADLDRVLEQTSGKYTESIRITRGAGGVGELELTATMRIQGVDKRVAGMTILLVSADGGKNWTCKAGTMPEKYLPAACRASQ